MFEWINIELNELIKHAKNFKNQSLHRNNYYYVLVIIFWKSLGSSSFCRHIKWCFFIVVFIIFARPFCIFAKYFLSTQIYRSLVTRNDHMSSWSKNNMSLFHISQETGKSPKLYMGYSRSSLPAQAHLRVQPLVWLCITFGPLLMLYSFWLECLFLLSSTGSLCSHSPILDLNFFFPMKHFFNPLKSKSIFLLLHFCLYL